MAGKGKNNKKDPVWVLIIFAAVIAVGIRFWHVGASAVSYVAEEVHEAELRADEAASETDAAIYNDSETEHLKDNDYLYVDDDEGSVVTMYLTVMPGNSSEGTNHTWAEVNAHPTSYYTEKGISRYKVEGLLQVGDENGPSEGLLGYDETVPNAIVQVRGQSSSRNPQKSYKISIKQNHGDWRGMKTIALNKHVGDYLRYRNKLGFDLLKGIPELPSLRTQFVHLYVRDETAGLDGEFEDYGLFTQVEVWNRTALRAHGFDRNGHLYKVINTEFYRYEDEIRMGDDPLYDQDVFEKRLEIKGDTDHSKLITMLEDVNNEDLPVSEVLEKHFDVTNLAYWLAFQILTGNTDSQNDNFYLYSPLNSERWYFLPWDLDAGFGTDDESIIGWKKTESVWTRGISNYWGNVLFRRCLQTPEFRMALDDAVKDLYEYMSEDRLKQMTDVYRRVTKTYIYSSPDAEYNLLSRREDSYDEIADRLPSLVAFYYENYLESLESPMPFYIGVPEITGNSLQVRWSESYDLQDQALTYQAAIAKDPEMKDVIAAYEGPERLLEADAPDAGQYFIRVWVSDEDGNEQSAFDNYHIEEDGNWIQFSGVRMFYVDGEGTVRIQ